MLEEAKKGSHVNKTSEVTTLKLKKLKQLNNDIEKMLKEMDELESTSEKDWKKIIDNLIKLDSSNISSFILFQSIKKDINFALSEQNFTAETIKKSINSNKELGELLTALDISVSNNISLKSELKKLSLCLNDYFTEKLSIRPKESIKPKVTSEARNKILIEAEGIIPKFQRMLHLTQLNQRGNYSFQDL